MKSKKLNAAFGRVLSKLRNERDWSQERLGFESELTRTYISRLERGKSSPTLDTVQSLAMAMGIDPVEVVKMAIAEYTLDAKLHP